MLVRFSVSNFKSFKDTQIFSMVAGKYTKHKNHIIEINNKRLLKGSFIFGANAAGKSNFIEAVEFSQHLVTRGLNNTSLINKHFRIENAYVNKPGVFQFDIYANGHFYSYGFAISYITATVEEEWLYLCDSDEIAIFERSIENGKTVVDSNYNFSDETQQSFKIFSENVPDNKMLLLEISERKLIENKDFFAFRDVMQWFKAIIIITPESKVNNTIKLYSDNTDEYNLSKLLSEFDTGIEDISLGEEKIEEALDFLPDKIKREIIQEIEKKILLEDSLKKDKPTEIQIEFGGNYYRISIKNNQLFANLLMMNHGNSEDLFEISDESDGTKRLFDILPVYNAGKVPCLILIDELDRSFHTRLIIKFIRDFYEKTSGAESQLIASVHDSNVMDLELLRQDEIWFIERQSDHSSHIYSLNKFKERYDKKVAKDYLLGRYGAIPCFTQLDTAEGEKE